MSVLRLVKLTLSLTLRPVSSTARNEVPPLPAVSLIEFVVEVGTVAYVSGNLCFGYIGLLRRLIFLILRQKKDYLSRHL